MCEQLGSPAACPPNHLAHRFCIPIVARVGQASGGGECYYERIWGVHYIVPVCGSLQQAPHSQNGSYSLQTCQKRPPRVVQQSQHCRKTERRTRPLSRDLVWKALRAARTAPCCYFVCSESNLALQSTIVAELVQIGRTLAMLLPTYPGKMPMACLPV